MSRLQRGANNLKATSTDQKVPFRGTALAAIFNLFSLRPLPSSSSLPPGGTEEGEGVRGDSEQI